MEEACNRSRQDLHAYCVVVCFLGGQGGARAGALSLGAIGPSLESQRIMLHLPMSSIVSVQNNRTVVQNSVIARVLDHTAWGLVCGGFYVAFCSTDMMIGAQMLDQG